MIRLFIVLLIPLILSGCATVGGAALGGYAGSKASDGDPAATALGTFIGAYIGNSFERKKDSAYSYNDWNCSFNSSSWSQGGERRERFTEQCHRRTYLTGQVCDEWRNTHQVGDQKPQVRTRRSCRDVQRYRGYGYPYY